MGMEERFGKKRYDMTKNKGSEILSGGVIIQKFKTPILLGGEN